MYSIIVGRRNAAGSFRFTDQYVDDGATWDEILEALNLSAAEVGEVYYTPDGDPTRSRNPVGGNESPGDGTVYTYVPAGVSMAPPPAGAVILLDPPGDDPLVVQPQPGGRFDSRAIEKVISGVNVISAPGRVGRYFLSLQDVVLVGTTLAEWALQPGSFAGGSVTVEDPVVGATIDLAEIAIPANKAAAGIVEAVVSATDGTDVYAVSCFAEWAAVRKVDTITAAVKDVAEETALSLSVASNASPLEVALTATPGDEIVTVSLSLPLGVTLTEVTVAFRIYDRLGNTVAAISHGETPEFVEEEE